jgi:hypothetical protein
LVNQSLLYGGLNVRWWLNFYRATQV